MNNIKNIQHIIDSRLSNLKLDDEFASKMLSKANRPRRVKTPLAIAAAVCLCIMLSIPIMAATIPSFNTLLSLVSTGIAQILQPIERVSENNGIKMEVVAAMNDDETAVAYLTMQDLTGNRIDKTIDLYNYSITGTNMFTSEVIAYDEITKTATIRLLANGGSKLNGKKVTVQVDSFLSDRHDYKEVATGIDLTSIQKDPKTIPLDMTKLSGGGGDWFETLRALGTIQILKTDDMNIALPGIDFADISNIGIVDGRLHVQIKWTGNGIDDHGFLYLIDAAGKIINPGNVSFGTDASGNTKYGRGYEEYIFDIGEGQLAQFKLQGYFVTNGNYVKGKWQTTFKIEAVTKSKQADCNIDSGSTKISNVSISPLGITILGSSNTNSPDDIDFSVTMIDGSIQKKFNTLTTHSDKDKFSSKYMPDSPLDIENVREVSINGNIIKFNP